MPTDRNYQIRNIVRAVLGNCWAIEPSKLEDIVAFLEARASGIIPSEDEIQSRFKVESQTADEDDEPKIIDGVQVVDVFGTLAPRMNLMARFSGGTSTQKLAKELQAAGVNDAVETVILRIDSPGGAASFTPEAAAAVRDLASKKRVVASATNQMASGAYWIGAAADEVIASPSTTVGSIGVYTILQNVKEQADRAGVKFDVFRAGDLKAAGNPYEELTESRKASIQKQVDDIYTNFIGDIASFRDVSISTVKNDFGKGSTFLASEAQSLGMIDGVATFDQVLERERKSVGSVPRGREVLIVKDELMDKKVKAALFANELIPSLDVSDDVAEAALATARRLLSIDDSASVDQIVSTITGPVTMDVTTNEATVPTDADEVPGRERGIGAAAERERINELRTRGRLLNVSDERVQTAIDDGTTVSSALVTWTADLANVEVPVDTIRGGEAQVDKLCEAGAAVISDRYGQELSDHEREAVTRYGASLENRRLLDITREVMKANGSRPSYNDYEDAEAFLSQPGQILTSGGSANRRGDHPDLMSVLTRKSLNEGPRFAQVTYPQWCQRIGDLPDFKPRSFIDIGVFGELDAITEDQEPKQLKIDSEMQNWIKADRYAGEVGLTIEMIVDDDLDAFIRNVRGLSVSSRHTLQTVILNQFHANPTMLDGNAFFSSAHNNLITTGGAPAEAQYATHRRMHRLQTSYGTGEPMGLTFTRVLVPAQHETAAIQSTIPVMETKTPATDATVNTFRGLVTPVVEARLDAYDTNAWYSLVEPGLTAAVVYAFQRGFGENGMQSERYDDRRKTRYFGIETRFGVALANWRAMIKNDGTA
jgi:signal peptide peptidase SppA